MLRLYLKALCELSSDGDKVRFVSLNDRMVGSEELNRYSDRKLVEWEGCDRGKLRFVGAARRMSLKSDRIVCGHVAQLPVAWLLSILRPGLTYYLVAHGIEVWRPFSFLERKALRGARRILCVSDFTRRQLVENCPLAPEKTAVLPNALDPYLVPECAPKPATRSPPIVLSISRLSASDSYKGIDHLVEALPAVRAAVPGARLRVVGRGDGLPRLQGLARSLKIADAVDFTGFLNDIELGREFEQCSLFALPSQKEGFGLVYLEAMARGRPCLGARSGGTPEVITEETGVLVEYGNVPAIAAAIIVALKRDWPVEPLLERARAFSYSSFRDRLAPLLLA
jgi:phosphatidyl-myo-inositol dimannoside synthase